MEKLPKTFQVNKELINRIAFSEDRKPHFHALFKNYDEKLKCIQWDELKVYYGAVLAIYPLNEDEKRVFNNLNLKAQFGYLTRRNIRIYNYLKLDKFFLDFYFQMKKQYTLYKKENVHIDSEDIFDGYKLTENDRTFQRNTRNFTNITISILSAILNRAEKDVREAIKEVREKKLEDTIVL